MRNSSYQEIVLEYGNNLDSYKNQREQLLSKHKYSIILEGESTELENLEKWISKILDTKTYESIYYDKTDYNYFFVEYFFSNENNALKTQDAIPRIFSTYHNANPLPNVCKTNGKGEFIEHNPKMENVIIL